MRYFSSLLLVFSLLALGARAQGVAYGDWQLHLPANHPLTLADAGDRLYVADESSFYYYDKTLNTTQRLSWREGLSDVGVSAVAYDSASRQVIVAYRNGNLDLLRADGKVKNVTDILRKSAQTAKTITQIQTYNGLAYLASNLGLIVVDLARLEVRDTYSNIGPGGQAITAYATAVVHDTIYASTSAGVLRGRISSAVNLLNYQSWTKELPNPSVPTDNFDQLLTYRGHVYAQSSFRGVYYLSGPARTWRGINGSYGNEVRRLRTSRAGVLFSFNGADLRSFNPTTAAISTLLSKASIGNYAFDMVRETDGTIYVASYDRGLLRFAPGTTTNPNPEVIRPNAPATATTYGLVADAATSSVVVLSGGYSGDNGLQFGRREGFYEYRDNQWTNYTSTTYPSATDFPNLLDMSHGTRTPDGTLYVASYGNGLLQWQGPGKFRQFTSGTPGSPLLIPVEAKGDANYTRVPDVATDPSGNYLWVLNRHQRPRVSGLYRYQPGADKWTTAPWFDGSENPDRVVVDNYGNPWVTQSRKGGAGLAMYDTLSRQSIAFGTGTTDKLVYGIARDRTGSIWIGTGDGVSYYSDPSLAISALANGTPVPGFDKPIVRRGTGTGFPVLYNTIVRCIAVDGANRKWFGTPSGLWLFSANADEALLHFTTDNSPLPSNSIVDVAVNDKTGEVFVATDGGVVSYQGSASITEGAPSCAEVYPNPVQPDFVGQVGIRGLVNNAYVKITDVAGHLVYSTRAAGGTVTWDLNDAQGRRVRSGVYLVLTSDAEGKNACVSKVAVVSK
jgi:hypothetical protein